MRPAPEKKIILLVGVLSMSTVFIIAGIIAPTVKDIYASKENIHRLRTYMEENYERTKHLRTSKEKVAEIKETVLSYAKYLFHHGDELKLITELENLASKNGLAHRIESSNLDKQNEKNLIINLNLTGQYAALFRYIAELESSDYFLTATRLQLTPVYDPQTDAPANYSLSLTLGMYVD